MLIELYKADLKVVQTTFMENRPLIDKLDENAPIFNNLPPIAGALTWATSLQTRATEPFARLLKVDGELRENKEFKDMEKLFEQVKKMLEDYKSAKSWPGRKKSRRPRRKKLNQPLLTRDKTANTLSVNFDPALVSCCGKSSTCTNSKSTSPPGPPKSTPTATCTGPRSTVWTKSCPCTTQSSLP